MTIGATRRKREVGELFLGHHPRLETTVIEVAAEEQPEGETFRYPVNVVLGRPDPDVILYAEGYVARDPSIPTSFDHVTSTAQAGGN